MYTVTDRSAATLLPIIAQSILPAPTVMSDLWAAYGGIGAMGQHLTVNHTLNLLTQLRVRTHKTSKTPGRMPSGGTKSNMEHIAQCLNGCGCGGFVIMTYPILL